MTASVQQVVGSWVRRANAGDQIAQAALLDAGEKARAGDARFKPYYDAALALYKGKRTKADDTVLKRRWWHFGRFAGEDIVVRRIIDPEDSKSAVPKGAYDRLFDPTAFRDAIVDACQYRHGIDGAAVVLSTGPLLDDACVSALGSMQGPGADAFIHGVKFTGDPVPATLDPEMRKCLIVGQCIGRARRLQMIRRGGKLGGVIGWELGE